MKELCPLCEKGELTEFTYSDNLPINNDGTYVYVRGLTASQCSHCDEVTMNPVQIRANNVIVATYKWPKS